MRKVELQDNILGLEIRINGKPVLSKFSDETIRKLIVVLDKNMAKQEK